MSVVLGDGVVEHNELLERLEEDLGPDLHESKDCQGIEAKNIMISNYILFPHLQKT